MANELAIAAMDTMQFRHICLSCVARRISRAAKAAQVSDTVR